MAIKEGQGETPSPGADAMATGAGKDKTQPTLKKQLTSYFRLLVYGDPAWQDIALLVTGAVAAAAAGVPFPLLGILFGELLDDMNGVTCGVADASVIAALRPAMYDKILKVVYVSIAMFFFIYIHVVSWSVFSQRLAQRLRDKYFQSLLRQEPSFFDSRQAGEVAARLSGDIQAVQSGTSEKVGVFIGSTSFFITAYIVAFIKDAKIAGMLVALLPAFLMMGLVGGFYVQKFSGTMSDHTAAAASIASEALSHVSVVKAFGAGPRLERKFASLMSKAQREGFKKAFAAACQAGMLYFIAYSANALAFWQGSIKIADTVAGRGDGTTVGATYTVVFVLIDACIIFGQVIPLLPLFGAAAAAFQVLETDIDRKSAIDSASSVGNTLPVQASRTVELRDVSFAYPSRPDDKVLRNVSITCAAGKHTAIVGLSGSGKSTVAGMVARLYDPSEGEVLVDGCNVRDLNVKNLRSCMSLVQQEPLLFNRSILENVALGLINSPLEAHQQFEKLILGSKLGEVAADIRNGRSLEEAAQPRGDEVVQIVALVRKATDLADATTFIDLLQNGFGTKVGNGGSLVSGGQRQRIALARALIRDPSVLILDEATAALDSASERRIQAAIENIARDRTLISIAHRLSTIKSADSIIVMSQGEVIEQGTYAELVALEGSFANLVRLQNLQSESSDDVASLASTSRETVDNDSSEKVEAKPRSSTKEKVSEPEAELPAQPAPVVAELNPDLKATAVAKRIARLVRPDLGWLLLAFAAAIAVGCTYSASGVIFGNIVGTLTPCNSPEEILKWGRFFGAMFFVLAVVELIANIVSWSCFGYVAEKLLYLVRVRSFRSLFEQGIDWHQSANRNPATLLSVITKDTAALGGFSGSIMGTIFSIVVNFLVAIILSHIIAWKIAIVCLVTVPILLGAGIMQLMALARFEERHADAFSEAVGITVEAVDTIRTIAALSLEQEILGTYRRALQGPRKEMVAASAYANVWLAIANSIGNFVYAFAYWWGSKLLIEGEYNQTQFFIIVVAMLVSAQLWGQMFSLAPEVSRARAATSRILNLMELGSSGDLTAPKGAPPKDGRPVNEKDIEATAESKSKTPSAASGVKVTFSDVSFAYPARPQKAVLLDASFTIQPGQFCGLVGPSGAGKSTIMAMVQRLYRPSTGVIEIDNVNISDRDGDDFRDDIAVVPQDCALFDGSVKFNVGLGARPDRDATDAEIEEACRVADIHDTIMALPNGYDTECGPNGSQLSGGQRQRLAIARAVVRKPRLLLLDESTSALDAESEKALQEGLERAARGITVIAVTHRLHTVQKADVILMIDGGRLVDQGTHEELMERNDEYRLNAMQQMLGA